MVAALNTWPGIHAKRKGAHAALVDGDTGRTISFAELDSRTNQIADMLRGQGVRPGDRIALITLNSPEMLELIFGIAKAGAVSVLVNFRLTAPEINYILEDSGASIAFASTVLVPTVEQAAEGTRVTRVVSVATAEERSDGAGAQLEELLRHASDKDFPVDVKLDDLAMIMYTSGTTGRPKGAMLTHGNSLWNAIQHNASATGMINSDINLACAPMFHIGALGVYTLPLLYWGGTSVIQEKFDPHHWAQLIEKYQVTKAFAVPTMWSAIVHSGALDSADLSSLKIAISGGSPCPLTVIEAVNEKGISFTEGFGMTETAPIASTLAPEDVKTKAGSVGKPVPHIEYRIVDTEGREVPVGEVGELTIRGPNVFVGYWNRPEATAEAFRGGWFHSGDLATVDEDGYYRLVDRKKDMIITGGENVYPVEVEQVLFRHPSVMETSVIGVPDAHWGEAVAAIVVVAEDSELRPGPELEDSLVSFARERLAGFKVPKSFRFSEELPKTATGKIRKNVLREMHTGSTAAVQR